MFFWSLNIGLALIATISAQVNALRLPAACLFAVCLIWAATGLVNRNRYHHPMLGDGWIEGELGVYSTFAFWGGVFLAMITVPEDDPYLGIVKFLVFSGGIGFLVSMIPLTRLLSRQK